MKKKTLLGRDALLDELMLTYMHLNSGFRHAQENLGAAETSLWNRARELGAKDNEGWRIEWDGEKQCAILKPPPPKPPAQVNSEKP